MSDKLLDHLKQRRAAEARAAQLDDLPPQAAARVTSRRDDPSVTGDIKALGERICKRP